MKIYVTPPVAVRFAPAVVWCVGLLSLATGVGCWEEIHYQPGPEPTEASAESVVAPATSPAIATPPAAEASPALNVPSGPSDAQTAPPLALDAPPLEMPPAAKAPVVDASSLADEASNEPVASSTIDSLGSPEADPLDENSLSGKPRDATVAERLHIWQATSKWGLAAAMYAKQLSVEHFEPFRDDADVAAQEIQIGLPPLPIPKSNQTPEQAVVEAFAGERTEAIVASIAERYGAEAGALARLALRSNQLLLVYSPKRENVAALAGEFTAAAEASGLPKELWSPLAALLDQRAEFVAVRGEVFKFQRRVEESLAAVR